MHLFCNSHYVLDKCCLVCIVSYKGSSKVSLYTLQDVRLLYIAELVRLGNKVNVTAILWETHYRKAELYIS